MNPSGMTFEQAFGVWFILSNDKTSISLSGEMDR